MAAGVNNPPPGRTDDQHPGKTDQHRRPAEGETFSPRKTTANRVSRTGWMKLIAACASAIGMTRWAKTMKAERLGSPQSRAALEKCRRQAQRT